MQCINKVTLLGRIGERPTLYRARNNCPYIRLSIATNERSKNEQTEIKNWHDCEAWGDAATIISKINPCPGQEIYIEGRIRKTTWDDPKKGKQYRTFILINDFKIFPIATEQATAAQTTVPEEEPDLPF